MSLNNSESSLLANRIESVLFAVNRSIIVRVALWVLMLYVGYTLVRFWTKPAITIYPLEIIWRSNLGFWLTVSAICGAVGLWYSHIFIRGKFPPIIILLLVMFSGPFVCCSTMNQYFAGNFVHLDTLSYEGKTYHLTDVGVRSRCDPIFLPFSVRMSN